MIYSCENVAQCTSKQLESLKESSKCESRGRVGGFLMVQIPFQCEATVNIGYILSTFPHTHSCDTKVSARLCPGALAL